MRGRARVSEPKRNQISESNQQIPARAVRACAARGLVRGAPSARPSAGGRGPSLKRACCGARRRACAVRPRKRTNERSHVRTRCRRAHAGVPWAAGRMNYATARTLAVAARRAGKRTCGRRRRAEAEALAAEQVVPPPLVSAGRAGRRLPLGIKEVILAATATTEADRARTTPVTVRRRRLAAPGGPSPVSCAHACRRTLHVCMRRMQLRRRENGGTTAAVSASHQLASQGRRQGSAVYRTRAGEKEERPCTRRALPRTTGYVRRHACPYV
jgi:hypothetical protein